MKISFFFCCFLYIISVDRTVQEIVDVLFPDLDEKDAIAEKAFLEERNIPVPQSVLDKIPGLQPPPTAASQAAASSSHSNAKSRADKPKIRYNDEVTFHLLADTQWYD